MLPFNSSETDRHNQTGHSSVNLAFSPIVTLVYLLIYMPIFVGILMGNLLVILAFARNARLRKVSNYFLLSLAVTDLFTGLFALPLILAARLMKSPATCYEISRFNFFLPAFVFGVSSICHVSAITIDRVVSVYCPLRYLTIVTPLRAKISLFVIWLGSVSFGFSLIFIPADKNDQWVCDGDHIGDNDVAAVLVGTGIFFPVYFVGILCMYVILLHRVMQRRHNHYQLATAKSISDNSKRDAKARSRGLVTMAIVVGAFGICWLPTSFQFLYEVYSTYDDVTLFVVQTICEYFALANSMVNPIIYARRNKEFHLGMRNAINCKSSSQKRKQRCERFAMVNSKKYGHLQSEYASRCEKRTETLINETSVSSSFNNILQF